VLDGAAGPANAWARAGAPSIRSCGSEHLSVLPRGGLIVERAARADEHGDAADRGLIALACLSCGQASGPDSCGDELANGPVGLTLPAEEVKTGGSVCAVCDFRDAGVAEPEVRLAALSWVCARGVCADQDRDAAQELIAFSGTARRPVR
jgi:hypothetical protein